MLGPLQVVADGETLPLGGVKQRSVLALLLLRAGTIVSQDELVDAVWGENGSVRSVRSLQVYVSNLRRVLARHDSSGSSRIRRQGTGYVLDLGSAHLDVMRFEELAAEGREALRELRPEKASARLGEALALWRGRPLADFAYQEWARRETDRLDELRLATVEDRIEADLVLGRHGELVAQLEQLTAEHPYREALAGQLMVALYRSGGRPTRWRRITRHERGWSTRSASSRVLLSRSSRSGFSRRIRPWRRPPSPPRSPRGR